MVVSGRALRRQPRRAQRPSRVWRVAEQGAARVRGAQALTNEDEHDGGQEDHRVADVATVTIMLPIVSALRAGGQTRDAGQEQADRAEELQDAEEPDRIRADTHRSGAGRGRGREDELARA